MGNLVVNNLRLANVERAKIWGAGGTINLDWRANELNGETGEACNILKKLVREAKGEVGSRAKKDDAIDELADVAICLDLFAMANELPEAFHCKREPDLPAGADLNTYGVWLSMSVTLLTAAHFMQTIAPGYNQMLGLESERMPDAMYRGYLIDNLEKAYYVLNTTARQLGVHDMRQAISKKFNSTSHKNGLPVFLNLEDTLTTSEVRSYIPD